MSIESNIETALTQDAGLTALIAGRVYNEELPQDTTVPAVMFVRIATTPENGLSGHLGVDFVRVQVSSWAQSPAEAYAVARAVRTAMALTPLYAVMIMESQFRDPDVKLSCRVQDYYLWD